MINLDSTAAGQRIPAPCQVNCFAAHISGVGEDLVLPADLRLSRLVLLSSLLPALVHDLLAHSLLILYSVGYSNLKDKAYIVMQKFPYDVIQKGKKEPKSYIKFLNI